MKMVRISLLLKLSILLSVAVFIVLLWYPWQQKDVTNDGFKRQSAGLQKLNFEWWTVKKNRLHSLKTTPSPKVERKVFSRHHKWGDTSEKERKVFKKQQNWRETPNVERNGSRSIDGKKGKIRIHVVEEHHEGELCLIQHDFYLK